LHEVILDVNSPAVATAESVSLQKKIANARPDPRLRSRTPAWRRTTKCWEFLPQLPRAHGCGDKAFLSRAIFHIDGNTILGKAGPFNSDRLPGLRLSSSA